jgi:hypothetical protein
MLWNPEPQIGSFLFHFFFYFCEGLKGKKSSLLSSLEGNTLPQKIIADASTAVSVLFVSWKWNKKKKYGYFFLFLILLLNSFIFFFISIKYTVFVLFPKK